MATARFPRSLLGRNLWVNATRRYSQSQKDKEIIDACNKAKEAADALKEGAKAVKNTSKYVKETAAATAGSVNKMTEEVTNKVKGLVSDATKATAEAIKDKIMDKK
ncbi:uncharacterized protein LOC123219962 [Mangifera indica]|uniref:uncharacterized protein LOC123219962 n=1 Tax=Mangifera indica TaxID=29780 RepID=UPI001CF9FD67|nr:uncharacterized protein LOC123219962 [Mangifera indica]